MKKILLVMLAPLILWGCSGKWKETAKINFYFSIENVDEGDYGFWFQNGEIQLKKISVEGNRLQSEDIGFQEEFEPRIPVNVPTGVAGQDLIYDLPQGTYKTFDVDLVLESETDSTPTITLEGYFRDSSSETHAVKVEISGKFEDHLTTIFPGERDDFSILRGQKKNARIIFNLKNWFSTVPAAMLEDAQTFDNNGIETIWISAERNLPIYSIILPRIGELDEVQLEAD